MCFIRGADTSGVPIGTIHDFGQVALPFGYVACDGASVLRTGTYAALFAKIGTTYGFVDGTHFNLPSAIGKTKIMPGTYTDPVSGVVVRTSGQSVGAEKHIQSSNEMPTHTHAQDAHTHTWTRTGNAVLSSTFTGQIASAVPAGAPDAQSWDGAIAVNQNTGSGQAMNNMQPSLVIGNVGIAYT